MAYLKADNSLDGSEEEFTMGGQRSADVRYVFSKI